MSSDDADRLAQELEFEERNVRLIEADLAEGKLICDILEERKVFITYMKARLKWEDKE